MSKEAGLLKISEIAEKGSVLPSTIRHYTDLGLLQYAATTDGGHRLYHEQETLTQLARIKRLAARGLSLPDIKAELTGKGKKRILVVDDEQEVCELVNDALKDRHPFDIRIVHDGFSAGRILADFIPDLVILDLMLPGLDGFHVCRQIRADQMLLGAKILAVTGYDTPENTRKILDAGADKLLTKPLDTRELLKAVEELLNITMTVRAV
ncbi:MAG TPA: response regulator [Elusimicrobiota bacterium]|nr:response regulator [Elusimicrobiota bacterium]